MNKAEELIKRHEGKILTPYMDTVGVLTIGYGYNLEEGISEKVAQLLFDESMEKVYSAYDNLDWTRCLSPVRKAVITNMIFNLGLPRFLGFKKMIAAIKDEGYTEASVQMVDSKWYTQVGARGDDLVAMMNTDNWL